MDLFSIFYNMRVYCVFSLESPHRIESNEYTQCTTVELQWLKHLWDHEN